MREAQTKTIGSYHYKVTQLPAGKARRLLTRLFKVAGPALGRLFEDIGPQTSLGDLQMSSVGAAIQTLATHMSEEDVEHIFGVMFESKSVSVENQNGWQIVDAEVADIHFAGDLAGMYRVLAFMLEVNYASFFAGAGGLTNLASRFKTPTQSGSSSARK